MKIKIIFLLLGSVLFVQGCALSPVMKTAAVTSQDQRTGYNDTILSQKKHLVSLSRYLELDSFDLAKDKTIFMLYVQNGGREPINIIYDNISVIFAEKGNERTSKKIGIIQSADTFLKDLTEEYLDDEYNFVYSYLWFIKTSGCACGLEPCFSKLVGHQLIDRQKLNQVAREAAASKVLRPQTIKPGEHGRGLIVCDTSSINDKTEGTFQILVSVDGEEHAFLFKRSL